MPDLAIEDLAAAVHRGAYNACVDLATQARVGFACCGLGCVARQRRARQCCEMSCPAAADALNEPAGRQQRDRQPTPTHCCGMQASRAALDARALEVLPPRLAKRLIKGELLHWQGWRRQPSGRPSGSTCPLSAAAMPAPPERRRHARNPPPCPGLPPQTCGRVRCARGGCPGTSAACGWPGPLPTPRQRGGRVSAAERCPVACMLCAALVRMAHAASPGVSWVAVRPCNLLRAVPRAGLWLPLPVVSAPLNLAGPSLLSPAADFVVSCALELHAAARKAAGAWQELAQRLALRCGLHAVRASVVLLAVAAGECALRGGCLGQAFVLGCLAQQWPPLAPWRALAARPRRAA